nr:MAG TPA: hypothetical protein [Microviridae sp.]
MNLLRLLSNNNVRARPFFACACDKRSGLRAMGGPLWGELSGSVKKILSLRPF